jgi:hypothetical protein
VAKAMETMDEIAVKARRVETVLISKGMRKEWPKVASGGRRPTPIAPWPW